MTRFFAILLTLVFLIQPIQKIWVLIDFEINKEFIAQNLCEQKDKPLSIAKVCAGSCQLRKNIQALDESSPSKSSTSAVYDIDVLFYQDILPLEVSSQVVFNTCLQLNTNYLAPYSRTFLSEILLPPIA